MSRSNRARPVTLKRPEPSSWYRIENKLDGPAMVHLYDEIGAWGISAAEFVKDLKAITADRLEMHINSPGGEVFDGMAIYNGVRNHPAHVRVVIDGVAASAASFVAMAGDEVVAEPNATLMIHDGQGIAVGDSTDMRKLADLLDKCSDTIAGIYAERAGGSVGDWRTRMRAETWYTAKEAVTAGLVDEVLKSPARAGTPRNDWDLSVFRYPGRGKAPDPLAPPPAPVVVDMACPSHDTATTGGTWDAGMHEKRMPSPMSMDMAKKMYAWVDTDKAAATNAMMVPKSAGKLPHHEVGEDGMPGPANLAGVRAALSRLPQSDIPEADHEAVRRHLRAHLDAQPEARVEPVDLPHFDPAHFRDLMSAAAHESPARPDPAPAPVDLGPRPAAPPRPMPTPALGLADVLRAAVRLAGDSVAAPPAPQPTTDPADEPGFSFDASAFRAALRRATQ